jgi:toxin ParE1/3/4
MTGRKWRVRLGATAELDFSQILQWTNEKFGARQTGLYRDTIVRAIRELATDPEVRGSKARNDIAPGLRLLHVARHGRRGRHFLLYRVVGGHIIEIGRILHDSMDVRRHVPSPPEQDDS